MSHRTRHDDLRPSRGPMPLARGVPRVVPMSLEARGEALAAACVQRVDQLLADTAVWLVNGVASARRVAPLHLAVCVPGLCHTHGPDPRVYDGRAAAAAAVGPGECAYCWRRGNCFAAAAAAGRAAEVPPAGDAAAA